MIIEEMIKHHTGYGDSPSLENI